MKFRTLFLSMFVAAAANAAIVFDFGSGAGITSVYPGGGGTNGSANGAGITLSSIIVLDGGALDVTGNGTLECVAGVTTTECGDTTGVTNTTAAGLGVGSNRVTVGEIITITVQPGYSASLVSFALAAFTPTPV